MTLGGGSCRRAHVVRVGRDDGSQSGLLCIGLLDGPEGALGDLLGMEPALAVCRREVGNGLE
jgi:hypothetical protein